MTQNIRDKINRFLKDTDMSHAVKGILMEKAKNKKESDNVYYLAAERIAIDIIEEAWDELEKQARTEEKEPKKQEQPGL